MSSSSRPEKQPEGLRRRNRRKLAAAVDGEQKVEIRKNKDDNGLQKKRNKPEPRRRTQEKPAISVPKLKPEELSPHVDGVWSDDSVKQLKATRNIRKLLTCSGNPQAACQAIEEVVQSGVVPRFVQFLTRDDFPELQKEAVWVLINIAYGNSEHCKVVLDLGALPILVKLLESSSSNDGLRDDVAWALANIAGDTAEFRDLVLSSGALTLLLSLVKEDTNLPMLRTVTWALSNLCMGSPPPPFELVRPILPVMQRVLHSSPDQEVVESACWALSCLSFGTNDKIQAVIEAGVCQQLVTLLRDPSVPALLPALRTIGNIVSGDDIQTQCVIDHGALACFPSLLTHDRKGIKRQVCWTISNITAGNKEQIQAVIEAGLVGPLLDLLGKAEFNVKKEAAWAISNATAGGTDEQIKYLVSQGCIKPLCDLLGCSEPRMITVCLEGLENILKVGKAEKYSDNSEEDVNPYAQMVVDCEGLDKIENLLNHDNEDIYEQAAHILDAYWPEQEDGWVLV